MSPTKNQTLFLAIRSFNLIENFKTSMAKFYDVILAVGISCSDACTTCKNFQLTLNYFFKKMTELALCLAQNQKVLLLRIHTIQKG